MKILTIFGTRPEAVKLAPVLHEFKHRKDIESLVCVTGQHRELLDPFLNLFEIQPEVDLNVIQPNQSLSALTARILEGLDKVIEEFKPDWVLVQGDTTSVFVGALVAYYHNIRVGHIEAGLRSHNLQSPFPEEANRLMADHLSSVLFAPTQHAKQALLKEGIAPDRIHITGNTVIDALYWIQERLPEKADPSWGLPNLDLNRRLILVTGHRRESFGVGFEQICKGLAQISKVHPDIDIVYPVHLNPNVQEPVKRILGCADRIHLIESLDYKAFVYLMKKASLILTDSGGVQEEAPALNTPVLIMRDVTERPEGVESGVAKLVGTNADNISRHVSYLLQNRFAYQAMIKAKNPYGDGQAARRIVDILLS
jgi:UDP-N-acetylglucosamine 2-epimerase (non-hydrolysing)